MADKSGHPTSTKDQSANTHPSDPSHLQPPAGDKKVQPLIPTGSTHTGVLVFPKGNPVPKQWMKESMADFFESLGNTQEHIEIHGRDISAMKAAVQDQNTKIQQQDMKIQEQDKKLQQQDAKIVKLTKMENHILNELITLTKLKKPKKVAPQGENPQGDRSVSNPTSGGCQSMLPGCSFVDFLVDMDCTKEASYEALSHFTSAASALQIPLFTMDDHVAGWKRKRDYDSEEQIYWLQVGGWFRHKLWAGHRKYYFFPKDVHQSKDDLDQVARLNIVQCVVDKMCVDTIKLPRFAVNLGEIFVASRPSQCRPKVEKFTSTNFFLLMDVVSKDKRLWMAFRHEVIDSDGELRQKATFGKQHALLDCEDCDIFQLHDVKRWKADREQLKSPWLIKHKRGEGSLHSRARMRFVTPLLDDLKEKVFKK